MALRVLHHDRCFDGACSAAVFTRLHQECLGGAEAYEYVGLAHRPGGAFDPPFGQGENAIVDFRYSRSERLTWWFDHHLSAFPQLEDRVSFDERQPDGRMFFDPDAISCTGLIAAVGRARFGFDTSSLDELLRWADIIDGARYDNARTAVEMDDAATKLTLVIENAPDGLISKVIPLLTAMPLAEVLAQTFVQEALGPLWDRHRDNMRMVHERMDLQDGVVSFDLTDRPVEGLSKFIPYYFEAEAVYAVALTRSGTRTKISVGTNPWTTRSAETLANIASLCERFGGGGHARVGAISFGAEELERGKAVAAFISEELRGTEKRRE